MYLTHFSGGNADEMLNVNFKIIVTLVMLYCPKRNEINSLRSCWRTRYIINNGVPYIMIIFHSAFR